MPSDGFALRPPLIIQFVKNVAPYVVVALPCVLPTVGIVVYMNGTIKKLDLIALDLKELKTNIPKGIDTMKMELKVDIGNLVQAMELVVNTLNSSRSGQASDIKAIEEKVFLLALGHHPRDEMTLPMATRNDCLPTMLGQELACHF
jgi:hypothetical protein